VSNGGKWWKVAQNFSLTGRQRIQIALLISLCTIVLSNQNGKAALQEESII
jgi:hypothetical protein